MMMHIRILSQTLFILAAVLFVFGGMSMLKLLPIEFPFGSCGLATMAIAIWLDNRRKHKIKEDLAEALAEAQNIIEGIKVASRE